MRLIALLTLTGLLAACGGSVASSDSGIRGRALIGPGCPVEKEGVRCPPRPIKATFVVRLEGAVVANVKTGADGRFLVRLDPGRYVLRSEAAGLPLLRPLAVAVRAHAFTPVTLEFDSGIR